MCACVCVCFTVVARWFSCWTANNRRWMFQWTKKQNESLDNVIICPPVSQQWSSGRMDTKDFALCFLDNWDVRRRNWIESRHWFIGFLNICTFYPGGRSYNWSFISTFFFVWKNSLIFYHLSDRSLLSALLTLSLAGSCTIDSALLFNVKSLYCKEGRKKRSELLELEINCLPPDIQSKMDGSLVHKLAECKYWKSITVSFCSVWPLTLITQFRRVTTREFFLSSPHTRLETSNCWLDLLMNWLLS